MPSAKVVGPVAAAAVMLAALLVPRPAVAEDCSRSDFEAVVGTAADALRSLNQANRPAFQAKLRELKTKRGWSQDQFLAEAAPIVQDATISKYDDESSAFLAHIEKLGSEGSSASKPDCSRLTEVRQSMQSLVDVQKAKWAYMFDKVGAELSR